jgi:phage shock protein A
MFDNELPDTPQQDVVEQVEPVVAESQPQEPTAAQAAPIETKHFRALREKNERIEREKEELARELAAYKQQAKPQEEFLEQEDGLAPDALVEKRHLSRYDKKIKKLEEQLHQYEQQSRTVSAEAQLRSKYNDFDSVVNKDNLEMLQLTYPELAQTIYANPDLYTKGASAYTIIKQMNIAPGSSTDNEKSKAVQNLAKPRPLASIAASQGNDSPLQRANAFANGLTDELRAQLHKEMIESMRNL